MIQTLSLLALLALGCRQKTAAPAPSRPTRVPTRMAAAPACEGASSLRIQVQPGDYLHAVAEQEDREVVLTLLDSHGRRLLQVDGLNAAKSPPYPAAELHWVADAPGELRIELTLSSGSRGPCGLRLAEHRRATAADRRRTLAETELARAHALRRSPDPKAWRAAVAVYESAQGRFSDLGLPRRRAEALLGLGLLQRNNLRDDKAALQAFNRANPFFSRDAAYEALVRYQRGILRFALGDLAGATTEYRRALELRRQLGDRVGEAMTANALGYMLHLAGHYDEAAALFDRSLALWQKGDDPGEWGKALVNRGQLHRQLGEMDQARERFNEALGLFRLAGDHDNEAAALDALGLLAQDQGQPAAAVKPLREALRLRPRGSPKRAVTLTTLGVSYRQLGRLEVARQAYAEALPIFRNPSREQALCLGNLGVLEASTGHDEAARDHFDRALELYETFADPPQTARTLEGKARVLRRHGNLETARKLMEDALATVEQHRFRQTSYNTRAEFFATQQGFYDFLIDLLMEMHREDEALAVSERSLARSLLDGLAASGTDFGHGTAAPELHARERKLEEEIDVLVSRETRLAEKAAPPEQVQPVEVGLRRRWGELDRVRAELRANDPRYAALTQPRPASAAEIQRRLLDPGTLLLEYRLGEKRSFLWAVTPDSLKTFDLPGRAEIENVAGPVCDLLSHSRSPTSAGPQLTRLSRLLIEPVAPLLPGKRLLVVGDGILQNVPFAALPEPGAGEPLVAHHEIVALPSVSVLGEIRREVASRRTARKALWVLANPDFGGTLDPLRHTQEEAASILALAPAPKREVLGVEANRAAVLNGGLGDYRFLHFATHGSFGTEDSGGGRLALAQVDAQGRRVANGYLYLADIYKLSLRADLVVLSACESALGREVRGEGMMGMTRGFFYAGAERVLVSLWNVNDRVTVELMRRFYRGMLVEKLSPAAALRAAQDAIRREPRSQAPYFWAGFTLQGEWKPEAKSRETARTAETSRTTKR
ncbi:MAG: CHAT domain-containing tetratricopeptide repeat protein [Thermoanaerobaculia bacterium]